MRNKSSLADRLSKMEILEGVLPSLPVRSAGLREAARQLRANDVRAAARTTLSELKKAIPDALRDSATELLSGSPSLREQVAGFADAGIGLFHASKELVTLPLAERKSRGASDMVSRVLISQQRILLETPRLVVRFEPGTSPGDRNAALKRHGAVMIGTEGLPPDVVRCAVTDGTSIERSLSLMTEPSVAYAEPDFVEHLGRRHTPGDPEFSQQWHHKNIQCESAWDVTKGSGISIGVVDNGFDKDHDDLVFGPLSGWFRSTPDQVDADFQLGRANMPDQDHGTACAGMIASRSGNGSGGCGVAFSAALNMIACAVDQVGTQSTLARALAYAARPSLENQTGQGVDVIACSLGPNSAAWEMRQVLSDAIDFATTQGRGGLGCAIFWACTNGNFPIGSDEVCSHPSVIAVGRSTKDDKDNGSGFGPQLEFLAPGVDVRIPSSGGGYQTTTGTSFAAPCAAGVAALALSKNPDLTAANLRQLMRDTCDKVGDLDYISGRNARFGHGRVNAKRAVDGAVAMVATV